MFATCRRYTRNEEDAKDLHNDAMLKIFRNLEQFKNTGPFEAWVHRIVVNTAINFNKAVQQYKEQTIFDQDGIVESVDNEVWSNIGVEEIFLLIRSLPPATQTVFNMFVVDGFSHNEIAKELGIGVNTSKWHVFYARKELQKTYLYG